MKDVDFSKLHGSTYSKFKTLFDLDTNISDSQLKNIVTHVQGTINDPTRDSIKIPYTDEAEYVLVRKDEYITEFLSKKKVNLPPVMGIGTIKRIKEINSQVKKPALLPLEILDAFGNLWQLNHPEIG